MQSNTKLEPATDEEFEEFKKSGFNYRSAVGRLAYITQCTRIDLCFTSGVLSQFLEKTSMSHVKAYKGLLRYLKHTLDYAIHFQKNSENTLIGYSDASWAEDLKRKSTSGYVFMIGKNSISWKSKKLGMVSSSSTESEYRALLGCCQES